MLAVDEAMMVSGRHGGSSVGAHSGRDPNESEAEENMSGTAENQPSNDDSKPDDKPDSKPDQEIDEETGKVFTQEQLDARAGKARNQGRQHVLKELADDFGMSIEEAKKFVKDQKEAERAQLEEHERLKLEAEETKRAADEQLAKAEAATLRANVLTALNQAAEDESPVRSDRRELAQDLAIRFAADAPDGEDAAAYGAAKVRESSPEWFGTSEGDQDGDGKSGGTPKAKGTPPPKKKSGDEPDSKSKYAEWKAKRKLRPLNSN